MLSENVNRKLQTDKSGRGNTFLLLMAEALTGIIIVIGTMINASGQHEISGGVYWSLPWYTFVALAILLGLILFTDILGVRLFGLVILGVSTTGSLGLLEPWGVFHDSWRNVGLGEMVFNTSIIEQVRNVSYMNSAPGSFLYYGSLSYLFPSTAGFLRIYPLFCVLIYGLGIYLMTTAFAQSHRNLPVNQINFAQMSVLAFFALSPLFLVRINPSPQSLSFALIPYFIASIIYGKTDPRFRLLAISIFIITVFIHPISAFEMILLTFLWYIAERIFLRSVSSSFMVESNTILLFATIFISWGIYIGIWVLSTGKEFLGRILDVFYIGQHTTLTANSIAPIVAFVWIHRLALVGVLVLIILGILIVLRTSKIAFIKILMWFVSAIIWLPLLFFGEFADRGQLFASLPAVLVIGYLLAFARARLRWLANGLLILTALSSFTTAYSDHLGEIIARAEISGFESASSLIGNDIVIYGYVPPLSRNVQSLYSSDQIKVLAQGAADFTFEKYSKYTNIVISDQMKESAAQRGSAAQWALNSFYDQLLASDSYELIFDNGYMKVFHTK